MFESKRLSSVELKKISKSRFSKRSGSAIGPNSTVHDKSPADPSSVSVLSKKSNPSTGSTLSNRSLPNHDRTSVYPSFISRRGVPRTVRWGYGSRGCSRKLLLKISTGVSRKRNTLHRYCTVIAFFF